MKDMRETKLNVFNTENAFLFDVNTPGLIKEACECCDGGVYPVVWMILKHLLGMVSERAIELNDPILNVLMIRLNLYEIKPSERHTIIKKLKETYERTFVKNIENDC